jgi:hypothetical protein
MVYVVLILALATFLVVIGISQHRKNAVVLGGSIFIAVGLVIGVGGMISLLSCSSNPLGYGYSSGSHCRDSFTETMLANSIDVAVLAAAILLIPLGVGVLVYGHRQRS